MKYTLIAGLIGLAHAMPGTYPAPSPNYPAPAPAHQPSYPKPSPAPQPSYPKPSPGSGGQYPPGNGPSPPSGGPSPPSGGPTPGPSPPSGGPTPGPSPPSGGPTPGPSPPSGGPTPGPSPPSGGPTPGPSPPTGGPTGPACTGGLYTQAVCCSSNIAGAAGLDCTTPPAGFDGTFSSLTGLCAGVGKQASCCAIPILGQGAFCQPAGNGGDTPTPSPGGNPTPAPGGNPTPAPGGNPTPSPGGNPTPAPAPGSNVPGACSVGLLFTQAQCCTTNLAGVATLDCTAPPAGFTGTGASLTAVCSVIGKTASCCSIPLAGQGALCQPPQVTTPAPTPGAPAPAPGAPAPAPAPAPGAPGPAPTPAGNRDACTSDLYSQAQCCSTDVLGVGDVDCSTPTNFDGTLNSLNTVCPTVGKTARCCVLPVLGQAVLCQPAGQ